MALAINAFDTKKRLLEDSCVLIERLKKMRALNADPRLVGINPRLRRIEGCTMAARAKKKF